MFYVLIIKYYPYLFIFFKSYTFRTFLGSKLNWAGCRGLPYAKASNTQEISVNTLHQRMFLHPMYPHWHIIQSPQFTVGFILGVLKVYSGNLDKHVMICIHLCGIIKSFLSYLFIHSFPASLSPQPQATIDFFHCLCSFVFSRMSHSWNHVTQSLFFILFSLFVL